MTKLELQADFNRAYHLMVIAGVMLKGSKTKTRIGGKGPEEILEEIRKFCDYIITKRSVRKR